MKILLLMPQMNQGGAEKSCLNLIEELKGENDITLYLARKSGVFMEKIPKDIEIIEGSPEIQKYFSNQPTRTFWSYFNIKRICRFILTKLHLIDWKKNFVKRSERFLGEYDTVICFFQEVIIMNVALYKTKAKTKLIVLHNSLAQHMPKKSFFKTLSQYNKVLCVSESCEKELLSVVPQMKGKTNYLFNMQNCDEICENAKQEFSFDKDAFNLLSVGRVAEEKGYFRMLNAIKRLVDFGYRDIVWNIVGEGNCNDLRSKAEEMNISNNIKLWGYDSNPYKYVAKADLFVLPSFFEAAPMVLNEALILGTPCLSTRTLSAEEIIQNYGWVCDNSEDGIVESLKEILENKDSIVEKRKLLKHFSYDNNLIKEKLYKIIEDCKDNDNKTVK